MKKRMLSFWDRWGYYLLAIFCAAVILLSAGWTNAQRQEEKQGVQAAADESQRLAEAQERIWQRPVPGAILRPFSEKPLFFGETGLWQAHLGVDFAAEEGEMVWAMGEGVVTLEEGNICIDHGEGWQSEYAGLARVEVQEGKKVKAGDALGRAGENIPWEGKNHVCIRVKREGEYVDFPALFGW